MQNPTLLPGKTPSQAASPQGRLRGQDCVPKPGGWGIAWTTGTSCAAGTPVQGHPSFPPYVQPRNWSPPHCESAHVNGTAGHCFFTSALPLPNEGEKEVSACLWNDVPIGCMSMRCHSCPGFHYWWCWGRRLRVRTWLRVCRHNATAWRYFRLLRESRRYRWVSNRRLAEERGRDEDTNVARSVSNG